MDISLHPSVDELKEALDRRGARLACAVCGTERFTIEEANVKSSGREQYFGNRRLSRAQVVCENCGHVMSFEVEKLRKR